MYPLRGKGNCRAFVLVLPVCSDHLEPSSHSTSDDLHFSYRIHCMSQVSKKTTNLQPTYIHLGSLFPWICWNIWLARNKQIFENRNFEAAEVLVKSIINARECQGAQPDPPPPPHLTNSYLATQSVTPQQKEHNVIIIKTDAAWKESDTNGMTGLDFH